MNEIRITLPNKKDYLSKSSASKLAEHPVTYINYDLGKFEATQDMNFGTAYEELLFNGKFSDNVAFINEDELIKLASEEYRERAGKEAKSVKATNEYKKLESELMSTLEGKMVFSMEEEQKMLKMANIMHDSGTFDMYIDGEHQVTNKAPIKVTLDGQDMLVSSALCKEDIIISSPLGNIHNDLKVTSSPLESWVNTSKKFGSDLQAYITMEVNDINEFTFIVQRNTGLFDIAVITVNRDSWYYESGKRKFAHAVRNYLEFLSPEAIEAGVDPYNYVTYVNI